MVRCEKLRHDAIEGGGHGGILFRKHRAQIEQHTAFVDARNDGGLRATQARGQFVGTEAFATEWPAAAWAEHEDGAAPPPRTDSPSTISTCNFGDRTCAASASARLPIPSFVKPHHAQRRNGIVIAPDIR